MGKSSDPSYQRDYYRKNRETIREKRRERYRTDARYRKEIKSRAMIASVMRTLQKDERPQPTAMHAGKREKVYYLNQVGSRLVDRDRDCLYNWQRGNPSLLPPATYEDSKGRRMYSESQIHFLSKLIHKLDTTSLRITYRDMRHILRDVWDKPYSEKLLVKTIREVLHGKYYEKDRKEDERRKKEGRKKEARRIVKTKADLLEL